MSTSKILGELGGVVQRRVGDMVYYFGTISSDKVKALTFVPVVERSTESFLTEIEEGGYQRPGSKSRMRSFMKYLRDHPSSVVPPVLLSDRGNWEFHPEGDDAFGRLIISGPAAIIDGQHRLGGYVALYEGERGIDPEIRPVDFILLSGLDREEEMEEFVIVNNTQKGVPKSLTTYLAEEEEAQIAWALNLEEDSPFKGRITRVAMQRQHLFALHSVAKQIQRMYDYGALSSLDVETKVEYAIRYWTIIADVLQDEWKDIEKLDNADSRGRKDFEYKLLELTGLIAWSLMAKYILGRSYSELAGMNWENVRRLVESCGAVDWRKDGPYAGRTGEVGGAYIAGEMQRKLPPEAGGVGSEEEAE
jgi:DNA sulfur modification protein DndB